MIRKIYSHGIIYNYEEYFKQTHHPNQEYTALPQTQRITPGLSNQNQNEILMVQLSFGGYFRTYNDVETLSKILNQ